MLEAKDAIKRMCAIQDKAAAHAGYEYSADCFCGHGGFWSAQGYDGTFEGGYRNDAVAIEFIEAAVAEKIERAANAESEALNARSTAGPNLKPIAESKVRQLGGDVCGVLVRNEAGAYAAVDEHGRVQRLDSWGEADRAQGDAVPVVFGIFYEGVFQEHAWSRDSAEAIALEDYVGLDGVTVEPLYTRPQPAQQGSVSDGWKLVPIASTSEMDIAAHDRGIMGVSRDEAEIIWNVMIGAAPQPPKQEGDQ